MNNKYKTRKQKTSKNVDLLKTSEISSITTTKKVEKKSPKSNIIKTNELYYLDGSKKSQVYHVFNNAYTFSDAKNKCKVHQSRLATPEELKEVYDNGAYWCNWGWSSDGHAYMPNKNLNCNKSIGLLKGDKLDPFLKLGVNCFGKPYE